MRRWRPITTSTTCAYICDTVSVQPMAGASASKQDDVVRRAARLLSGPPTIKRRRGQRGSADWPPTSSTTQHGFGVGCQF